MKNTDLPNWKIVEPDLMWLAGLLEGEGTFTLDSEKLGREKRTPIISLSMTDLDVIQKAAKIMGATSKIKLQKPKKENWKDIHSIRIFGYHAIRIMTVIVPHMGLRRSEQIWKVLEYWETNTHTRQHGLPTTCGHSPHRARGLCCACYFRYRKLHAKKSNSINQSLIVNIDL